MLCELNMNDTHLLNLYSYFAILVIVMPIFVVHRYYIWVRLSNCFLFLAAYITYSGIKEHTPHESDFQVRSSLKNPSSLPYVSSAIGVYPQLLRACKKYIVLKFTVITRLTLWKVMFFVSGAVFCCYGKFVFLFIYFVFGGGNIVNPSDLTSIYVYMYHLIGVI